MVMTSHLVCYRRVRVAGKCLAERLSSHSVALSRIALQLVQVAAKIRVSVRVAVGEVDGVTRMREANRERQSAVEPGSFPLVRVLEVANTVTASVPAFAQSGVAFGVDERTHSVVVERVGLEEVDYVEAVSFVRAGVRYSEVVPLRVPLCQVVRLKYEVVLVLVDLYGSSEVAGLEPRLKDQRDVVLSTRPVERRIVLLSLLLGVNATQPKGVGSIESYTTRFITFSWWETRSASRRSDSSRTFSSMLKRVSYSSLPLMCTGESLTSALEVPLRSAEDYVLIATDALGSGALDSSPGFSLPSALGGASGWSAVSCANC